jgi:hypothetical protein
MSARRKAAVWAIVVVVCAIVVVVKVRVESSAALEQARALRDRGETMAAGLWYRRAIRWYTPLSSSVETAAGELWALAEASLRAGKPREALGLFRDLRGALYAIRHVLHPYRDVRERCEEQIASLMAAEPATTELDRGKSQTERRALYLAQMRSIGEPDVLWSIALLLGFFGWIAAALSFFWRGFTPDGALLARPAVLWGGVGVACFALWVVGMMHA